MLTACGFESRLAHHLNIEVSHSGDCNGLQNRRLTTHVGSSPTASAINNWATVVHSCAAGFESSSQSGSTPVAQGAKQWVGKPSFEKSFQLIDKIKFLLYNIYDENLNFHIIFLPYNRR